MAIRHKRKNTSAYQWQSSDLVDGQIGLNVADGTLHFKKSNNDIVTLAEGGSGISAVEDDTAPKLGGDLDVAGFAITSDDEIKLTVADNADRGIQIAERNVSTPENPVLATFIEPVGDETRLAMFSDNLGLIGGDEIRVISQSVNINNLIYPNEDGDPGDVLVTDGSGNLSFAPLAGGSGISAVEDDTAPKLGGNLDVSTFSIISTNDGNIAVTPNGTGKTQLKNIVYNEVLHLINGGNPTSGTLSLDAANGSVQFVEINGNITINGFANAVTGQSITLIVESDDQYTLTSSMFFAGGDKTLTDGGTDVITIFYTGQDYLASIGKDFK